MWAWLYRRVDLLQDQIGAEPTGINVRDLGSRWGSCGRRGTLNFHWRTILLSPRIIEYIAAHELIHLHESYHTPDFWQRLERAIPDYVSRKQWLAENGAITDI